MTNYAAGDILVYKDGSTTERASTSGFTATTDFDSKTGKHLAVIDLSDNTTSGFWNAGSEYIVAIDSVTIDAVTTGGWIARFRIGYPNAIFDTTIATLSSQTSFTLTTGPAEDDALNGHWAIIHDIASAVQMARVLILDYTGSTKTVTLAAGGTFTAAAGDNISIMDMAPLQPATLGRTLVVDSSGLADANMVKMGPTGSGTAQTARDIGASVLLSSGTGTGQLDFTSGVVKANVTQFNGSAAVSASGIPAVNVTHYGGSTGTFTGGRPEVNTSYWVGGAINAGTSGVPIVDVRYINNTTIAGTSTQVADRFVTFFNQSSNGFNASTAVSTLTQTQVTGGAYAINSASFSFNAVVNNAIADQVWDEVLSGHLTAGSTGYALNAAGSAGDPWSTVLPGAYSAGTAGHIVGTALPDAAPGSSDGLLRGGSNAATTFASLTCTGAFTVSDGIVVTCSTTDRDAISATGNGAGSAFRLIAGSTGNAINASSTSGHCVKIVANGTFKHGVHVESDGDGNAMVLQCTHTDLTTSLQYGHGLVCFASDTSNGNGIMAKAHHHGCGMALYAITNEAGLHIQGGATGRGIYIGAGASSGVGLDIVSTSTAIRATASNGDALQLTAGGTGSGAVITAGTDGHGISVTGGATSGNNAFYIESQSGDALRITVSTLGHGINVTAAGSSRHGIRAAGGSAGTSDGVSFIAGTGGVGMRVGTLTCTGVASFGSTFTVTGGIVANITGNLSGSVGSVTGNVGGDVVGSVASVTGNVSGSIGSLATQAKADVNAEVLDVLNVDTFAEPGQGSPSATNSIIEKIRYIYKWMRNKKDNNGTTNRFYADDGTTVDQKQTTAESGGTVTVGEITTGP